MEKFLVAITDHSGKNPRVVFMSDDVNRVRVMWEELHHDGPCAVYSIEQFPEKAPEFHEVKRDSEQAFYARANVDPAPTTLEMTQPFGITRAERDMLNKTGRAFDSQMWTSTPPATEAWPCYILPGEISDWAIQCVLDLRRRGALQMSEGLTPDGITLEDALQRSQQSADRATTLQDAAIHQMQEQGEENASHNAAVRDRMPTVHQQFMMAAIAGLCAKYQASAYGNPEKEYTAAILKAARSIADAAVKS